MVVLTVQQTVLHVKAGVAVVQGQARVISESAHCESMYRFQGALRVAGRSTVVDAHSGPDGRAVDARSAAQQPVAYITVKEARREQAE